MSRKSSEPYISTYFHQKGRQLGLPIAGSFELTAGQWLDIARQARDRGMVFALLTGGEPLMRKDFFEIYKGMKDMGLLISVNSNGSMLSSGNLKKFLEDPPCRFNISLYGGSNETYENMCGKSAYAQVKENIRALRKAGIDVSLNLSITPYNCHDLTQIYADAVELDVNVRASSYMYPPVRLEDGTFGVGKRLSACEAAQCAVKWDRLRFAEEELDRRAENMLHLVDMDREGCPVESGEGIRCRAGSTSFWMTWDGRMLPCGMMTQPEFYPLDVGFETAWEQLRAATSKIRTPIACTNCDYKDVCSVCAAVCYTETGRFDGVPEYVCEKTRQTVRFTQQAYAERKRT